MNREAKKVLHRQRLLNAALHVFVRHGYERATVEQIATRARVSKGTAYNYFADKRALYLAVVDANVEDFFRLIATATDPDDTPRENVERVVRAIFAHHSEHPARLELLSEATTVTDRTVRRRFLDSTLRHTGLLAPLIELGRDRSILRRAGDSVDLVLCFVGVIHVFLRQWDLSGGTFALQTRVPLVADFIMHGAFVAHD